MQVNVRLFALARNAVGRDSVSLELTEPATVGDVRAALRAAYPVLDSMIGQMLMAVDAEYADDDQPVTSTSEIACIPPVSGGE